jgi:transposase
MRARPTYTPEFQADAPAPLARTDRSLNAVAQDLGISCGSLRSWYQKAEMAKKKPKKKPQASSAPADGAERERHLATV